ncbi:hypothetical protein FB45DRAFT_1024663 [Roridomyces roridus]|uniref:DUF6697 domain-containing protein n=1 Tax=Roridomyces roridus TaxID=1738132 RepID=A0AAD7FEJ5_9AGAR|nr:hypothetical protein FB45DRAFT_1035559 [Roridomyces roridus]KAJ7636545.1 hypothetical protein FB45DRAFT_1024663 [Roridomyces roridus]
MDDFKQLRLDNQRLKDAVERMRRERDDAEAQLAASRLRITELESQVRRQAIRISDLTDEGQECVAESKPATTSMSISDVIEISDDDGGQVPLRTEGMKSELKAELSAVPVLSTVAPTSPEALPPGRLNRRRSESSPIERASSSTFIDHSLILERSDVVTAASSPAHKMRPSVASTASPQPLPPGRFKRKRSESPLIERASLPQLAKVKVKKIEEPLIPQDAAAEYLRSTPDLIVSPPALDDLYVPRKFLGEKYGGSTYQFFQNFKTENQGRVGVFPQPELNPLLPTSPGKAGLIFSSRRKLVEEGPWALFCRSVSSKKVVWRYIGEYEAEVCGQFQQQNSVVKQHWAEHIRKAKQHEVYIKMRARIALRKAGRDPTDDGAVAQEVKHPSLSVTKDDILEALESGEEGVNIIRLKCVSYDREFAVRMERDFDGWISQPKENKDKGKKKERNVSKAKISRPRRVATPVEDSDSEDGAHVESEDEDEERDGCDLESEDEMYVAPGLKLGDDDSLSDLTELEE